MHGHQHPDQAQPQKLCTAYFLKATGFHMHETGTTEEQSSTGWTLPSKCSHWQAIEFKDHEQLQCTGYLPGCKLRAAAC